MNKKLFTLFLIAILALSFGGCSKNDIPELPEDADYGDTLYVFNWGEYIDTDVLKQFEQETGIKIVYDEYTTNEIMYPLVENGTTPYDIVIPSDYMIEKMINEDMLYELDFDNIPNYKYIDDKFKNLDFDPNNSYSVPYMWGTIGILYNTDLIDEGDVVDSWDILWDEKYADSILMQDSVRDSFAVALKKLGYSLNTTDEAELEEAKQLLIEQKPLVQAYVVDQVKDKMIGNEAALAVIWSGEALYTQEENDKLEFVVPKEGSNVWFDSIVIPKTSQNKKGAEMFIDFLCDPEIAFLNTDYIGYSTPNTGAKEMLDDEILNNPAAYPSDDILDNCEVFIDVKEATEIYNEKWKEVKSH